MFSDPARLDRLEESIRQLQSRLDSQIEAGGRLADGLAEVNRANREAFAQFQKALSDQEERWTAAHKQLTETAIEMMQQALLKAFARKLLDWLWTLIFGAALIGLGWLATRIGLK